MGLLEDRGFRLLPGRDLFCPCVLRGRCRRQDQTTGNRQIQCDLHGAGHCRPQGDKVQNGRSNASVTGKELLLHENRVIRDGCVAHSLINGAAGISGVQDGRDVPELPGRDLQSPPHGGVGIACR